MISRETSRFILLHPVKAERYVQALVAPGDLRARSGIAVLTVVEFSNDGLNSDEFFDSISDFIDKVNITCGSKFKGLAPKHAEQLSDKSLDAVTCSWFGDDHQSALLAAKAIQDEYENSPIAVADRTALRIAVARHEYSAICTVRRALPSRIVVDEVIWNAAADLPGEHRHNIERPHDSQIKEQLKRILREAIRVREDSSELVRN